MKFAWVVALVWLPNAAVAQQVVDYRPSLRAAVAEVGRAWNSELMVDPAIAPPAAVSAPRAESLEAALDGIIKQLHHAAWRRVRLAGKQPTAARLAATIRAAERLKLHPLIEHDPSDAMTVTGFGRDAALSDERSKDIGLAAKPVYILLDLDSRDDGRTPYERLAELQKRQWETMGSLPASQRLNPMLQFMQMAQGAEPGQIENALQAVSAAGTKLWQSTPPDQRKAMMERAGRTLNQAMTQASSGVEASPRNWLPELRALCTALANRSGAPILVDPALFVARPPEKPASGARLEAALAALAKPIDGAMLRKVELPPDADPKPAELAADVRALEGIALPAVEADDGTGRRWLLAATPGAVDALVASLQRKQATRQVYVICSRYEGPPASPEERYAQLQRQQFQALLNLDAGQLGQAMGEAVDSFNAATPADQEQMMGLPLMATLMGVWFPRAAKERMP